MRVDIVVSLFFLKLLKVLSVLILNCVVKVVLVFGVW